MTEKDIVNSALDSIIGISLDGKITFANDSAIKLLGFTKKNLLKFNYQDLKPPNYPMTFDQIRSNILFNIDYDPIPSTIINNEGKYISVITQYSPIRDSEGKIVGVSKVFRKMSDFEKAASHSQSLLETAPDAIVIVNKKGQIILANAQTENLFGYAKQELLGQDIEILIPDKYLKRHKDHRDEFIKKPKFRNMGQGMELNGKKKNGDQFPIEISLSPLKTEEGLFVSAAIRDITESKSLELDLLAYNQQLQTKNKELEQFAYVASHDLQEPLRTVTSLVELIDRKYNEQMDETGKKSLSYISDATQRMNQLILGLLDYSRLGRNLELKTLDLNKVVQDVLQDMHESIESTNAEIIVEQLPKVKSFESEIRTLFVNLISNGIKFVDEDKKPIVKISSRKDKGHWEFCVCDNGIGIDKKHRDRIFVLFQRLNNRSDYDGTGIGLAHVRKIVELHGGKIWVESSPQGGSTFKFTLSIEQKKS